MTKESVTKLLPVAWYETDLELRHIPPILEVAVTPISRWILGNRIFRSGYRQAGGTSHLLEPTRTAGPGIWRSGVRRSMRWRPILPDGTLCLSVCLPPLSRSRMAYRHVNFNKADRVAAWARCAVLTLVATVTRRIGHVTLVSRLESNPIWMTARISWLLSKRDAKYHTPASREADLLNEPNCAITHGEAKSVVIDTRLPIEVGAYPVAVPTRGKGSVVALRLLVSLCRRIRT